MEQIIKRYINSLEAVHFFKMKKDIMELLIII